MAAAAAAGADTGAAGSAGCRAGGCQDLLDLKHRSRKTPLVPFFGRLQRRRVQIQEVLGRLDGVLAGFEAEDAGGGDVLANGGAAPMAVG